MNVSVIGMGFVGIPLAVALDSAGHDVVGYDIDQVKIFSLQKNIDPTDETSTETLERSNIKFTSDPDDLRDFDYAIITVPTPVDEWKQPDLSAVESAGKTVGKYVSHGATVVLESTVYPGATREVLVPALESSSGLEAGADFSVGYSPERITPGRSGESNFKNTNKIVSALDEKTLAELVDLYELIVDVDVHPAPTIETAEAAKCLENVQRDVNIGLINEFVMGCYELDIDLNPKDVLEAAGTKPAFHPYRPGLVGGHCIPVDPYFLMSRFDRSGYHTEIIEAARRQNEAYPKFLAELTVKHINKSSSATSPGGLFADPLEKPVGNDDSRGSPRVLLLGLAYKPNVNDLRNDVMGTLIEELKSYGVTVHGHDPLVPNHRIEEVFQIEAVETPDFSAYDSILLTALHDEFLDYDFGDNTDSVLDLTGEFRFQTPDTIVWEGQDVS